MAHFETYKDLTAEQIGQVLLVKLGDKFRLRAPEIQRIPSRAGHPDYVFKAMIGTDPNPLLLDQGEHFMYFISRISGKDMNEWLDAAVAQVKEYANDRSKSLKF